MQRGREMSDLQKVTYHAYQLTVQKQPVGNGKQILNRLITDLASSTFNNDYPRRAKGLQQTPSSILGTKMKILNFPL